MLLGLFQGLLGWAYCLLGDLETAGKHIEKGLEIQRDSGLTWYMAAAYGALGMVHLNSGDLGNARRCVEESLKLAKNNNEKSWEGVSKALLGRILGKADPSHSDKAEEYILQGINILDELKLRPSCSIGYLYLGELYADTGQREKALENLKKAQGMFQEMGMDHALSLAQNALARLQA